MQQFLFFVTTSAMLGPEHYPPSQKTTGLPVDESANNQYATARCRP
ncbi:MAG: hypothetical protein JRE24_01960 [Deltaproteobacteria bacterium]|nr:hypothetical protein [Deltaproteobacteria bacterium]